MSTTSDEREIDTVTRTAQIIGGALAAGVAILLGVAIVIVQIGAAQRGGGAGAGAGPGAAPGQGAGANAAPQRVPGPVEVGDIITWLAVACAAISLPLSFVLPSQIAAGMRRSVAAGTWMAPTRLDGPGGPLGPDALQSDAAKLAVVYQTYFIVGAAIIEGVAFFATAAYIVEKSPIALGLALLLLGALAVRFPTRTRVGLWIEQQQELLMRDRQAAV
jgi:hypothetical protein